MAVTEAVPAALVTPRRSPVAAGLGVLSVALLGASLRWAHHWGPLADTVVAAWVVATLGALVLSILLLLEDATWLTYFGRRLAKIGLAGAAVSLFALALAGIAFAAGVNVSGACGGG
jgi:hypothetical protein